VIFWPSTVPSLSVYCQLCVPHSIFCFSWYPRTRAAAASSAARAFGSRPSSAACSASCGSSSAPTLSAFSRSKRFVYSSTAASPRDFTSARICATERSIASSSLASNASTARSAASKPSLVESSLRMVMDMGVPLR